MVIVNYLNKIKSTIYILYCIKIMKYLLVGSNLEVDSISRLEQAEATWKVLLEVQKSHN